MQHTDNPNNPKDNTNEQTEVRINPGSGAIRVVVDSVPPSPAPTDEEKAQKNKEKRRATIKFYAELVIGLFVVVYTVVTVCLWRSTQHANSLAEQALNDARLHFRQDERAWIGIEPLKPRVKAPANDKFTALYTYDLSLKNSGKTVARCVEVRLPRGAIGGSLEFGDHEDWVANWQDKFLFGKFKGTENGPPIIRSAPKIIAPGEVTPIPLDIYGQVPKVYPNGQEYVNSFVGRIDYIDEFDVRHWIKFCMFIAQRDGSLWYCKYGNDEDRNPEIPPKIEPSCPVTQQ